MRKFEVVLHLDAEKDISSIFDWGCSAWGKDQAKRWILELRNVLRKRLTSTPRRCPVAPESEELGITVRHLIFQRYRILFIVEQRTVTVLHIKGSYAEPLPQ